MQELKDAFFSLQLVPHSQPLFSFEWNYPDHGFNGQLTWTRLSQGYENSATIFSEVLHKDLDEYRWSHPQINLLQFVYDLLIVAVDEKICHMETTTMLKELDQMGYPKHRFAREGWYILGTYSRGSTHVIPGLERDNSFFLIFLFIKENKLSFFRFTY